MGAGYMLAWLTQLSWMGAALAAGSYRSQDLNSDALIPLRTHSIAAPYVDSNLQNKFWDFGGDTIIDTARYIRLTQDKPSQSGWLWSRSVSDDATRFPEVTNHRSTDD